jgi:hypothetical protein
VRFGRLLQELVPTVPLSKVPSPPVSPSSTVGLCLQDPPLAPSSAAGPELRHQSTPPCSDAGDAPTHARRCGTTRLVEVAWERGAAATTLGVPISGSEDGGAMGEVVEG